MRAAIVVGTLGLALGAARPARADSAIDLVTKLGFQVGFGGVAVEPGRTARTSALGLGLEHPVFDNTRVFGEYEYLWIGDDARATMGPLHGDGQRMHLGLRHALAVMRPNGSMRLFLDGELGVGAMLASTDSLGARAVPDGVVGVRAALDLRNAESTSRVLELEVGVRAVLVPDGAGIVVTSGVAWGE